MKKVWFALLFAGLCACECLAAGIDRQFFDALLRLPSLCGDEPELERVVEFTRAWLEKRGVCCVVETNNVGRVALYASTRPGKVQDYLRLRRRNSFCTPGCPHPSFGGYLYLRRYGYQRFGNLFRSLR